MMQGTIKTWFEARGYGFIKQDASPSEVFVHIKSFTNLNGDQPLVGDRVEFEAITMGTDDRMRAVGVKLLGSP